MILPSCWRAFRKALSCPVMARGKGLFGIVFPVWKYSLPKTPD